MEGIYAGKCYVHEGFTECEAYNRCYEAAANVFRNESSYQDLIAASMQNKKPIFLEQSSRPLHEAIKRSMKPKDLWNHPPAGFKGTQLQWIEHNRIENQWQGQAELPTRLEDRGQYYKIDISNYPKKVGLQREHVIRAANLYMRGDDAHRKFNAQVEGKLLAKLDKEEPDVNRRVTFGGYTSQGYLGPPETQGSQGKVEHKQSIQTNNQMRKSTKTMGGW